MNVNKVIQNSKGEMKIEYLVGWDECSLKTPEGLSNEIRIALRSLARFVNEIAELRIPSDDIHELISIDGVEYKDDSSKNQGMYGVVFFRRRLTNRPGLDIKSQTPKLFQNARIPEFRVPPGFLPEIENVINFAEEYLKNNEDAPLFRGVNLHRDQDDAA